MVGTGKNIVSMEFCRGPLYCPDFLDLKIQINNAHLSLSFSIYDKRDDFNFDIVNFPFMDNCIPKKICTIALHCTIYYSQLIRYFRLHTNFLGVKTESKQPLNSISQGYLKK